MEATALNGCCHASVNGEKSLISLIDRSKVPKHVAIIMDGNRRWAKQRGLDSVMGHWEGAETLMDVVKVAADLGVQTLTVYSFSTENWERPSHEVESLMQIFELYLVSKRELMVEKGIRLDAIGDISRFPEAIQKALEETRELTKDGSRINLVLALNYGARDEIRRAILKILEDHKDRKISKDMLTEECIAQYLDTGQWGDPDFLIRTSGELRVSNFLLWQICYTEIYVTDVLWPDFSKVDFYKAILDFQNRARRYGGV